MAITHAEPSSSPPIGGVDWDASHVVSLATTINYIFDGGGTAIPTGIHGDVVLDFNATVLSWKFVADQTGSIVVDVYLDSFDNFPPVVGDAMPNSGGKPTISGSLKGYGNASAWTKRTIVPGDVMRFVVDSCSSITRATLSLEVTRS